MRAAKWVLKWVHKGFEREVGCTQRPSTWMARASRERLRRTSRWPASVGSSMCALKRPKRSSESRRMLPAIMQGGVPDDDDGKTSALICLGGTRWHADGPGNRTDAPNMSNSTETAVMGHGDGARCGVEVADGIESHEDASIGHIDAQTVETDADTTIEAARQRSDNSNAIRNPTDAPRVRTDVHNIANNTQTIENAPRIVRTHQNVLKI